MYYLYVVIGALVLSSANAKNFSPCPGLFSIVSQQPGQQEASLTLYSETDLHGLWVRLIFDSAFKQLEVQENFLSVSSNDNTQYLLKNRNYTLKADQPVKTRIFIKYDGERAPKLIGFRLNARSVCPEHGEALDWIEAGKEQNSDEYFLGDLNNKNFLSSLPEPNTIVGCGTVPLYAVDSPQNGEGRWPWQVSIYLINGKDKRHICSGTLISPNHVITAAHCVTRKNTEAPVYPVSLKVHLGEHFLNNPNKGLQEFNVNEFTVHPGYNPINLDNNLAIMKLENAVKITDYVRPICLWDGPLNLQTIVSQEGFVAGFGFDEDSRSTDQLTYTKLKVIASDVCLNTKPGLAAIFNIKSICGGYSKANSVCVGESGSGVSYIRDGGKPVYQLRSVVSVGAGLQNNLICDDTNYIVLTDTAKHLQWIKITIVSL